MGEKEYRILIEAMKTYMVRREFHEYLAKIIGSMQKNGELPH